LINLYGIEVDVIIVWRSVARPRHLSGITVTCFVLLLQLDPVFDSHFELLVDEVVRESVPARVVLDEVVLVRGKLFDRSIDGDASPTSHSGYQ